ncbi:hypothetical protein SeLEV6574_g04888, partial [Synchytrium endobioticum]
MAFHWDANELNTLTDTVASAEEGSTFFLKLRKPLDIPKTEDFGKFL